MFYCYNILVFFFLDLAGDFFVVPYPFHIFRKVFSGKTCFFPKNRIFASRHEYARFANSDA